MHLSDFKTNIILAPYTSLGVGGPADYFYEAKNEEDLTAALKLVKEENISYIMLGGGTNVMVSDNGFSGLVIVARNNDFSINGENIFAGAGCPLGVLVASSAKNGLAGLEWAAGLPGTLGGAIYGNAGTFGKSISDIISEVKIIDTEGKERIFNQQDCEFGYRKSIFQNTPGVVIVSAKLKMQHGDSTLLKGELKKNALWRLEHHPPYKSAGCIFRNSNPSPDAHLPLLETDQPKQWFDKVPSGWLIDKAGLKGSTNGGFIISEVHGNFFINNGTGTAKQLNELIEKAKKDVNEKFGVALEEEVRRIGF